jgi:hypothetical protein
MCYKSPWGRGREKRRPSTRRRAWRRPVGIKPGRNYPRAPPDQRSDWPQQQQHKAQRGLARPARRPLRHGESSRRARPRHGKSGRPTRNVIFARTSDRECAIHDHSGRSSSVGPRTSPHKSPLRHRGRPAPAPGMTHGAQCPIKFTAIRSAARSFGRFRSAASIPTPAASESLRALPPRIALCRHVRYRTQV